MVEQRLKIARNSTGLSQRKFAEKMGIAYRSLQTYEKNAASLTITLALKIASYCNINPTWLLTGEGEMNAKPEDATIDFVDASHAELITKFKQKELAKEINRLMVELEKIDPGELNGLKELLEFKHSKKMEQCQQTWDCVDRRKTGR
jgi:transcriptional regulator with XRE-family HTH domain